MNNFNLALDNLLQKKRVFIFLIIFILLAVAVGFILVYKFFYKKPQAPNEGEQAPAVELPQTNPFEEVKTNPFKDIKTNPFE